METTLRDLCDRHTLTAIGVSQLQGCQNITVYLHFGEDGCVNGEGPTFDEAMAAAVSKLTGQRDQQIHQNNEAA